MLQERWRELRDFPGYAISDQGRVINTTTDLIKNPSRNQQGIKIVNFSVRNQQHVRSVSLLIAQTFVDRNGVPPHFDTPIHLDGDRGNCAARNLLWRPRWFAVRYHKQFTPEEREQNPGFRAPVLLVDTEEIFPSSWEAAIKYGLLDMEIFLAMVNATYVFPYNYTFEEYIGD